MCKREYKSIAIFTLDIKVHFEMNGVDVFAGIF